MDAIRAGEKQVFRKLLSENPKAINLNGPGGSTPLMYAALYGDLESVRILLERGADPNLRNDSGTTALMWAVLMPKRPGCSWIIEPMSIRVPMMAELL